MKSLRFAAVFLAVAFTLIPGASLQAAELVVYTYDSFMAQGGLGPEILPLFEAKCRCRVRALSVGDAGQLLTRLQLDAERKTGLAHVVLGLDQRNWEQARPYLEYWDGWKPSGYRAVLPEAKVGDGFLPFDYGIHAFVVDRKLLASLKLAEPRSLGELLGTPWKRNILLQDPRTSAPGLAFLLFTEAVLGKKFREFWSAFRSQWLTLAPGWDASYSMFLRREAPLVWSYTTSQAYHVERGKPEEQGRYAALLFEEGQPIQIEGAALVKNAVATDDQRKLARSFLEFLISREVQSRIPLKNWMLPVRRGTALPASFKALPKSVRIVKTPVDARTVTRILGDWGRVLGRN